MGTVRRSIVPCLFLALLVLCIGAEVATGAAGARRMSCVVRARVDPAVMPMDFKTVAVLLRSDGVAGRAASDVWGAESEQGRDFYRVEPLASEEADIVQLALAVQLPDGVQTAARAFGDALIENLRVELQQVFDAQVEELQARLRASRQEVETAQRQYCEAVEQGMPDEDEEIKLHPDDEITYRQLDETVDLSGLSPEMPLAEAVRVLSSSVEPRLRVVVLWKDLLDNAQIESTTPIDMYGLGVVQLEAGLKALLRAVAGGFTQLDYVIDHGVVTVATDDSLPALPMEARVHRVPATIRTMRQAKSLAPLVMAIEPETWFDLADYGEGTVEPIGEAELLILQTRPIHRKIQQFLRELAAATRPTLPVDVSQETLGGQMHLLLAYRDKLQAELADLEERQDEQERARTEAEERHSRNSWDQVSNDLREIVYDLQALRAATSSNASGPPRTDEIDRIIDKAKTCLERPKREPPAWRPFTFSDLGSPWSPSAEELALMKRLSSQRAAIQAVTDRIAEIDRLLAGPRVFDPEVDRIRRAAARFQEATARVEDLQQRLANPRPPSVTVLGGAD